MEKTVGDLIKNARRNLGLTYEELAIFCEMAPSHLYKIETARIKKPHLRTLKILADYLSLDFSQLMEISGYLKLEQSDDKTLANMVKKARMNKAYSQVEVAQLSGISKNMLSYIESGKRTKIQSYNLRILADCLNLNFNELMKVCGYQIDDEKTFANVVKGARLYKGFSLKWLSLSCEISISTLMYIETGKITKLKPKNLQKLANCLELDFDELMEICGYQSQVDERTLANLIKTARLYRGFSLKELSLCCGISVSTLNDIETEKVKKLKPKKLRILADVLDLNFDELLKICGYSKTFL